MIKHILKHTVFLIPPGLLLLSLLLTYVGVTNYYFIGDLAGYSLMTNLIFIYHFVYCRKYCKFTKYSCWGLLLMTFVSLLDPILAYQDYRMLYDALIVAIVVFLAIYYTIKEYDIN